LGKLCAKKLETYPVHILGKTMIEFKSISKSFGMTKVLDNITFTAYPGEILGLIGHNGAGKTTLLNIGSGQIKPDFGTVNVFGFDVLQQEKQVKSIVGLVTAEMKLNPRFTVEEVLKYHAILHNINENKINKEINEVAKLLNIDYLNVLCKNLSTGMAQRVLVARSLINKPQALFFDEASNGLDVLSRKELRAIVENLAREGKAIVFSTHILSELEGLANRSVVIRRGCVIHMSSGFDPEAIADLVSES
jgi:ABC-type multidrug transport system ATPase subunit